MEPVFDDYKDMLDYQMDKVFIKELQEQVRDLRDHVKDLEAENKSLRDQITSMSYGNNVFGT